MEEIQFFSRLSPAKEKLFLNAIAVLRKWRDHLLITGFSNLQNDKDRIHEISSRMVDMGLPGIARKLRLIPEKIEESSNWSDFVFIQMAELFLFIESIDHLNDLDELEKEDLLSFAGIVYKKSDFSEDNILQDEWIYLGHQQEKEENLIIKRNWFYGVHSKKFSLFIEFQFSKFVRLKNFELTQTYRSAVRYFPSKFPLRVKDISTDQVFNADLTVLPKVMVSELLDQYCEAIRLNPFLKHLCFVLHNCHLSNIANQWFLSDEKNQSIGLNHSEKELAQILSALSNKNTCLVGEYYNNQFRILALILQNHFIELII